jgi:hypothetical protein
VSDDTTQLPFLITLGDQLAERAAGDEERLARGGRFRRWGERRRTQARRRTLALGGAGAAVLAAGALVLTADLGGDGGGRRVTAVPATAKAVLLRAARAAAAQPDAMPGADQLTFVHSQGTRLQSGDPPTAANTKVVTLDRRIWTSPTQPGRLYETPIAIRPLLGGAAARLHRTPSPQRLDPSGRYRLGGLALTRRQLLTFPTDPTAIVARFRAARAGTTTASLFDQLGDALRESPAPPAVRAGLYQALATLPGVRLVGATRDPRGRRGVAVGFMSGGVRDDLVIDPRTAEMLAERSTLVDPAAAHSELPAGTVIGSTVYLRRAAVDSTAEQ